MYLQVDQWTRITELRRLPRSVWLRVLSRRYITYIERASDARVLCSWQKHEKTSNFRLHAIIYRSKKFWKFFLFHTFTLGNSALYHTCTRAQKIRAQRCITPRWTTVRFQPFRHRPEHNNTIIPIRDRLAKRVTTSHQTGENPAPR